MSNCGSKDRVNKTIESWFYDETDNNFAIHFRVPGARYGYTLQRKDEVVTQEKVEQLVALLTELDPNGFTVMACDSILTSERPKPEPLDCLSFPPFRHAAMRVLHEQMVPFLVARLFTVKDLYRMMMNLLDALDTFDREVTNFRRTADSVATDKQWLQCYELMYHILGAVRHALVERRKDIMRLADFKPEDAVSWDEEDEW